MSSGGLIILRTPIAYAPQMKCPCEPGRIATFPTSPSFPDPKSETRRPKEGRNPKSEKPAPAPLLALIKPLPAGSQVQARGWSRFAFRVSGFGLRPSFGLRISGFGFSPRGFPQRWSSQDAPAEPDRADRVEWECTLPGRRLSAGCSWSRCRGASREPRRKLWLAGGTSSRTAIASHVIAVTWPHHQMRLEWANQPGRGAWRRRCRGQSAEAGACRSAPIAQPEPRPFAYRFVEIGRSGTPWISCARPLRHLSCAVTM